MAPGPRISQGRLGEARRRSVPIGPSRAAEDVSMTRRYFGTDGIRGLANAEPLTRNFLCAYDCMAAVPVPDRVTVERVSEAI